MKNGAHLFCKLLDCLLASLVFLFQTVEFSFFCSFLGLDILKLAFFRCDRLSRFYNLQTIPFDSFLYCLYTRKELLFTTEPREVQLRKLSAGFIKKLLALFFGLSLCSEKTRSLSHCILSSRKVSLLLLLQLSFRSFKTIDFTLP